MDKWQIDVKSVSERKTGLMHFQTVLQQARTEPYHHYYQLCRSFVSVHTHTAVGEGGGGADTLVALSQTLVDWRQGYQIDTRRKARVGEESTQLYVSLRLVHRKIQTMGSLYALVDTPLHFNTNQIHSVNLDII